MASAISAQGLEKTYGELRAVDGLSFDVEEGTIFAFLGPNGAGKTTTVEILEGLRRATAGEVKVLGLDPWKQADALHHRIGVIPQEFRFFDKTTPREAIEYYATLFDKKADADELLRKVELTEKAESYFDTLSGGQKQKLGLALALVNDPPLLFLDEPTSGLDPHARRAIWEVIKEAKRGGRTVFLTTHYLEEAELLAERVAIINHGKIIAEGSPEEIIREHGTADRLVLEGPPALADHLAKTLGLPVHRENGKVVIEMSDKRDVARALEEADRSGLGWTSVSTARDSLEDVFVRLVGRMEEGIVRSGR